MSVKELRRRFDKLTMVYQNLCKVTSKSDKSDRLNKLFDERANKFRSYIERIEEEFSRNNLDIMKIDKMIFNFKEQLIDFLPILFNNEELKNFLMEYENTSESM